jgi:hypothetical protein
MRVAFYRSHVAHYLPHVAGLALSLAEKPNAVPWDKKEGAGQAVFSAMHDLMRKAKREMEAIPTYTDPSVLLTSGQSWTELLHHAPTDEVVLRWVSVQVGSWGLPAAACGLPRRTTRGHALRHAIRPRISPQDGSLGSPLPHLP